MQLDTGAGDQGMMIGFACNETPELMPLHDLARPPARASGSPRRARAAQLPYLRPMAKSQVTVEYDERQARAHRHRRHLDAARPRRRQQAAQRSDVIEHVIRTIPAAKLLRRPTQSTSTRPARFVIGGPKGDAGLTGRKIIVDTYGGMAPARRRRLQRQGPDEGGPLGALRGPLRRQEHRRRRAGRRVRVPVSYAIGVAQPRRS